MKRLLVLSLSLLCVPYTRNAQTKVNCPCVQKSSECPCATKDGNSTEVCRCIEVRSFCDCAQTTKAKPLAHSVIAEIGYGELIDKITILEIKLERINDSKKRENVARELAVLNEIFAQVMMLNPTATKDIAKLKAELRNINETLWDTEDSIRAKEASKSFDNTFIALARNIYKINDKRSQVKRAINTRLGSRIVEEKSYTAY